MFVLKDKKTGLYMKGKSYGASLVELQKARTFETARNAKLGKVTQIGSKHSEKNPLQFVDLEPVEVKLVEV